MENLPEVSFGTHFQRWIVTYPLDKVIRPLNNWGQVVADILLQKSSGGAPMVSLQECQKI